MKAVHIFRKPCSESTVAANTLKHGTGALNIDMTRVLVHPGDPVHSAMYHNKPSVAYGLYARKKKLEIRSMAPPTLGRWPANLILQHLDGCRQDGVKKVCPGNGSGRAGAGANGFRTAYVGGECKGAGFTGSFVDGDGTETVAAWACVQGCPVADLDASGRTSVTGRRSDNSANAEVKGTNWGPTNHKSCEYPNDKGGASRFFKQVKP